VTRPAIRTQHLTKRFGDALALDALDLVVEPGEVAAPPRPTPGS
jgi:ABC-type multidrug transport system ATPase subunit